MKRSLHALIFFALTSFAFGQAAYNTTLMVDKTTGEIKGPVNAAQFRTANGITAGTGTVTNFSAGDLSPLFTTTEANTTTTPALSFSLTAAPANSWFGAIFAGAPSYNTSALPPSLMPAPSASTLGGVESYTAPSHQFINSISTAGVPSSAQPATADLSDGSNIVKTNQANTYTAGSKQRFQSNGSTAGEGSVGVSSDPSGVVEADRWYRNDTHRWMMRDNSASQQIAWVGDFAVNGTLSVKPAVAVVSVANLTLSGEQTIDGVTTSGSLVLATAQTTGSQNGPWLTGTGAWTRPTWYATGSTTLAPQFSTIFVRLGSTYQGTTWRMTTASVTIGTTATTWNETPLNLHSTSVTGALPVAQLPALTGGDVTSSAGSGNLTIGPATVTYSKMQNVSATARILGRKSAGAGSPEELSPTDVKSIVTYSNSDVGLGSVTNDAQTKASIVPNTVPSSGKILVGNGTAYAPVTVSGSGAVITLNSSGVFTINSIPNASLSNSTITIAGTSTALGGSIALDTILGLSSNGFVKRTGTNTYASDTATYVPNTTTVNGHALSANVALVAGDFSTNGASQLVSTNASGQLTELPGTIVVRKIASGVDLRTAATTSASSYTCPANFVVTGFAVRTLTASGVSGNVSCNVKDSVGGNNLSGALSIQAGAAAVDTVSTYGNAGSSNKLLASGTAFTFTVATAATAGTWTADVYIYGYVLP